MATIQSIIDRVTYVTKDVDHVRWTLPEISRWLNDAMDQITTIHPRASTIYATLTLAQGARQDLRLIDPNIRWVRLHELVCNVVGSEPTGAAIRQVPRPAVDLRSPNWRSRAPTATVVKEYMLDERDTFTFDVNPPVAAGTKVLALASARANPCMAVDEDVLVDPDEEFPLAPGYDIPAVDYILFRAFSKDANEASYAARAQQHLQAFQLALGVENNDGVAAK